MATVDAVTASLVNNIPTEQVAVLKQWAQSLRVTAQLAAIVAAPASSVPPRAEEKKVKKPRKPRAVAAKEVCDG